MKERHKLQNADGASSHLISVGQLPVSEFGVGGGSFVEFASSFELLVGKRPVLEKAVLCRADNSSVGCPSWSRH